MQLCPVQYLNQGRTRSTSRVTRPAGSDGERFHRTTSRLGTGGQRCGMAQARAREVPIRQHLRRPISRQHGTADFVCATQRCGAYHNMHSAVHAASSRSLALLALRAPWPYRSAAARAHVRHARSGRWLSVAPTISVVTSRTCRTGRRNRPATHSNHAAPYSESLFSRRGDRPAI